MAAGFLAWVYATISSVHELWTAGLAPWVWQIIGALIFVTGVVAVLVRWHSAQNSISPIVARDDVSAKFPAELEAESSFPSTLYSQENEPLHVMALKLLDPKFELHATASGELQSGECKVTVSNETQVGLNECLVVIDTVQCGDKIDTLKAPVRTQGQVAGDRFGRFKLTPHQSTLITLCSRDYKDIISNPPYKLLLEDSTYDLLDEADYIITMTLYSESKFPTTAKLFFRIGRKTPRVTLTDQFV